MGSSCAAVSHGIANCSVKEGGAIETAKWMHAAEERGTRAVQMALRCLIFVARRLARRCRHEDKFGEGRTVCALFLLSRGIHSASRHNNTKWLDIAATHPTAVATGTGSTGLIRVSGPLACSSEGWRVSGYCVIPRDFVNFQLPHPQPSATGGSDSLRHKHPHQFHTQNSGSWPIRPTCIARLCTVARPV